MPSSSSSSSFLFLFKFFFSFFKNKIKYKTKIYFIYDHLWWWSVMDPTGSRIRREWWASPYIYNNNNNNILKKKKKFVWVMKELMPLFFFIYFLFVGGVTMFFYSLATASGADAQVCPDSLFGKERWIIFSILYTGAIVGPGISSYVSVLFFSSSIRWGKRSWLYDLHSCTRDDGSGTE